MSYGEVNALCTAAAALYDNFNYANTYATNKDHWTMFACKIVITLVEI